MRMKQLVMLFHINIECVKVWQHYLFHWSGEMSDWAAPINIVDTLFHSALSVERSSRIDTYKSFRSLLYIYNISVFCVLIFHRFSLWFDTLYIGIKLCIPFSCILTSQQNIKITETKSRSERTIKDKNTSYWREKKKKWIGILWISVQKLCDG